jgi:hypothetical protein
MQLNLMNVSEFVLRIQFNLLTASEDIEKLINNLNIIIIFRRGFYPYRRIFVNLDLEIDSVIVDDIR